ncbi:SIS domain-containing protein [Pelagibacteraceae bacterium]|nr:SIS domain-containing protein [Pelagibacteraceae bacterium]
MKFERYFKNYNKSIYDLLIELDTSLIDRSVELILKCKRNNGKVFIVGNGGSSSIASHVSVDFAKVANVQSNTFNNANLITCFANDYGHENWVKEAIKAYTQKNDILILISSSGNSINIINAAKYCNENNIPLITFSGFDKENHLAKLGNVNIHINSNNYNYIEMSHHIILVSIVDIFAENLI